MLERYAVKIARTVLRGGSGSNVTPLPDLRTSPRNCLKCIFFSENRYHLNKWGKRTGSIESFAE